MGEHRLQQIFRIKYVLIMFPCIAISNNENAEIFKFSHFKIFLDTKEEVIAGSTRLKAGTSQKSMFKYNYFNCND